MFTAATLHDKTGRYLRHASAGLLLLAGVAGALANHTGANAPHSAASEAAARARIVDEVEPLYRAMFPKRDTLRFLVVPGVLHPHRANETPGWIVECYDNKGDEIAHGLWDERGKRHITVSRNHHQRASPLLPFLSAEAAARTAREWLYRSGMAIPQNAEDSIDAAKRYGDVWHVTVRLSDGAALVWMNARTGEVHQVSRCDNNTAPGD